MTVKELIEKIKKNMESCNLGEVNGILYESGYKVGVNDVIKMLEENIIEGSDKTNKTKATEAYPEDTVENLKLREAFKKGADWKDTVIRDEIEEAIKGANKYYDNNLSESMISRYIGMITVLCKISGIPFPYDKLHMSFATLD